MVCFTVFNIFQQVPTSVQLLCNCVVIVDDFVRMALKPVLKSVFETYVFFSSQVLAWTASGSMTAFQPFSLAKVAGSIVSSWNPPPIAWKDRIVALRSNRVSLGKPWWRIDARWWLCATATIIGYPSFKEQWFLGNVITGKTMTWYVRFTSLHWCLM